MFRIIHNSFLSLIHLTAHGHLSTLQSLCLKGSVSHVIRILLIRADIDDDTKLYATKWRKIRLSDTMHSELSCGEAQSTTSPHY